MNICAMSFGPPIGLIISAILIVILIFTFLVLMLIKLINNNLRWRFILLTTFLVPIVILVMGLVYNLLFEFVTSPMKVKRSDIEGDYVINTSLFKGENADWQYEHYWIRIKKDSLYLKVMNEGKLIGTYKKKIKYSWKSGGHRFFEFYNDYSFRTDKIVYIRNKDLEKFKTGFYESLPDDTVYITQYVTDSVLHSRILEAYPNEHHMLKLNPLLHADPFMFNVVLRSTKYGNMFFRKGKWKNKKE